MMPPSTTTGGPGRPSNPHHERDLRSRVSGSRCRRWSVRRSRAPPGLPNVPRSDPHRDAEQFRGRTGAAPTGPSSAGNPCCRACSKAARSNSAGHVDAARRHSRIQYPRSGGVRASTLWPTYWRPASARRPRTRRRAAVVDLEAVLPTGGGRVCGVAGEVQHAQEFGTSTCLWGQLPQDIIEHITPRPRRRRAGCAGGQVMVSSASVHPVEQHIAASTRRRSVKCPQLQDVWLPPEFGCAGTQIDGALQHGGGTQGCRGRAAGR